MGDRPWTRLKIAIGVGALALVGGGTVYYLSTSGTPDDGGQALPVTSSRPSGSTTTRLPLSPLATPTSGAGLNARNPFLGDATTTTATTGTGTSTGTSAGTSSGQSTGTSTGTSSGTTTTSGGAGPVYVTVLSVAGKGPRYTAVFLVNGVRYTQDTGSTFGSPANFSYDSTTVVDDKRCARFTYGDEGHTLCPGEQINVA